MRCITKADQGNEQAARRARIDYQSALHLFPPAPSGQAQPVLLTSAVSGAGLPEVWEVIENYAAATRANGYFEQRRQQQQLQWLHQSIAQALESRFYADAAVRERLPAIQQAVAAGRMTPFVAATALLGLPGGATVPL